MDRDPTMRATLKVQSKNNIIEAGLRKHIQIIQRQCEVNLSQIDHDRLDVIDLLKQIRRCTTDDLPEVKHWLGNRTPSGTRVPRTTRLTFRNQSAPTGAEQEEQARQAELQHLEHAREYEMLAFRSSRPKPELVQRTMALHKLFSRRNLYAGTGHAWDAWGMTGFNDPEADRDLDSAGTATFQDGSDWLDSDTHRAQSPDNVLVNRRESNKCRGSRDEKSCRARRSQNFRDVIGKSLSKSQQLQWSLKQHAPHDCGRPGCQGHQSQDDDDLMKELLVGKSSKKRKKKEPLQERINDFFDRMDVAKEEERRRTILPSQIEMHR